MPRQPAFWGIEKFPPATATPSSEGIPEYLQPNPEDTFGALRGILARPKEPEVAPVVKKKVSEGKKKADAKKKATPEKVAKEMFKTIEKGSKKILKQNPGLAERREKAAKRLVGHEEEYGYPKGAPDLATSAGGEVFGLTDKEWQTLINRRLPSADNMYEGQKILTDLINKLKIQTRKEPDTIDPRPYLMASDIFAGTNYMKTLEPHLPPKPLTDKQKLEYEIGLHDPWQKNVKDLQKMELDTLKAQLGPATSLYGYGVKESQAQMKMMADMRKQLDQLEEGDKKRAHDLLRDMLNNQARKELADLKASLKEKPGGKPKPTKGQIELDKAAAKDYNTYVIKNNRADVLKALDNLYYVRELLKSGKNISGSGFVLPDIVYKATHPEHIDAKNRMGEISSEKLRQTLGAQFTEKEGERLLRYAWDPQQDEKINLRNIEKLIKVIEDIDKSKMASFKYFEDNDMSMQGYKGTQFVESLPKFGRSKKKKPPSGLSRKERLEWYRSQERAR